MTCEWWRTFFSETIVDFWKKVYDESRTKAEADFIQGELNIPPGAAILDVPCGEGRLTRELASRGYGMTGVDLSLPFLDQARASAAEKRLDIRWEHRDMRDLPWHAAFDGAFCFGNSFGYLDDEGNAEFLRAAVRAMKPGARFVLDAGLTTEMLLPRMRDREWMRVGNYLFLEENNYDHAEGRFNTDYTIIRDGQMETKSGSHRIYTYRELIHLMRSAGFSSIQSFGSLARDPFTISSPQLFLVGKVEGRQDHD